MLLLVALLTCPPTALTPLELSVLEAPPASDALVAKIPLAKGHELVDLRIHALPKGGHLALWSECARTDDGPRPCALRVGRVGAKPAVAVTLAEVTDFGPGGPTPGSLRLSDVDRDGTPEVVVTWDASGEPVPAAGAPGESFAALLDLRTLTPRWTDRIGAAGGGGQDDCEIEVHQGDLDCDKDVDLLVARDCTMSVCRAEEDEALPEGCEPPQRDRSVVRFHAKTRTWRAEKPVAADAGPRWLVVAAQHPLTETPPALAPRLTALRKAGFKAAAIRPSTAFDALPCCRWLLVAGAYPTRAAALKAVGKLKGLTVVESREVPEPEDGR
jgi:hypothetical protein